MCEPIRDPDKYSGCYKCESWKTCPDAFYSNAVGCNAYNGWGIEIVKREGGDK